MRFGYSEEQRQLGETARRLFERQFRAEVVRRFADGGPLDPAWTREMSEAGLFGICAPAEVGGLGLGVVDAIPLLTEAGRHLVPYPLVESIVASRLLAGWQDQGLQLTSTGEYFASLAGQPLPLHEIAVGEVPGRSGTLALQGPALAT